MDTSHRSAILIAVLACCAWSNSFGGPFVLDDLSSIVSNPTICHLWPPDWMHPPTGHGETVGGRPLLNLSFAINHWFGGTNVFGYHAFNLVIHALAAVVLFDVIRRTLRLRSPRGDATALATAAAALWAVHPLQTAAVTYVVQRAESLAGLFFLLTMYGFVRAAEVGASRRWSFVAVGACLLGTLTKETLAVAPLAVFVFDATLIGGSIRSAWRARWRLHCALAATLLVLAALVHADPGRGGSAGFHSAVGVWPYLLTQCEGIVRYVGLAFWPSSLIFDYGTEPVRELRAVLTQAILIVGLLVVVAVLLFRRHPAGFLGAWFFLTLAPSSSFVPISSQVLAEHRMVLPLAALAVGFVLALDRWLGRRAFGVFAIACLVLGGATWNRNAVYASEFELWRDTVVKRPNNARALNNVGLGYLERGQAEDAVRMLRRALALQPQLVSAQANLGNALGVAGHPDEAVAFLRPLVAAAPDVAETRVALGNALTHLQRIPEAIAEYREALRVLPQDVEVCTNLAAMLIDQGEVDEATRLLDIAIRGAPSSGAPRFHLGRALLRSGKTASAIEQLREAIRLAPSLPSAHLLLADALAQRGDLAEAVEHYRIELAIDPSQIPVRNNLGNALVRMGRIPDAIREFEIILQADPTNAAVRHNLEYARAQGRP